MNFNLVVLNFSYRSVVSARACVYYTRLMDPRHICTKQKTNPKHIFLLPVVLKRHGRLQFSVLYGWETSRIVYPTNLGFRRTFAVQRFEKRFPDVHAAQHSYRRRDDDFSPRHAPFPGQKLAHFRKPIVDESRCNDDNATHRGRSV